MLCLNLPHLAQTKVDSVDADIVTIRMVMQIIKAGVKCVI